MGGVGAPRRALLIAIAMAWVLLFAQTTRGGLGTTGPESPAGWLAMTLLHLPYLGILIFLGFGLVERVGFFWRGRAAVAPGRPPASLPMVCVQLPMFNEHAVGARVVEVAAALDWPSDRLVVQVLDDSTDAEISATMRQACVDAQARTGVRCAWIHRENRTGYKAGALEAGRRLTDADFIAIFDADFVPPRDYLRRAVPHFYDNDGGAIGDLALVQAQWGHLNDDESLLTAAQALWVDDHHTLQQSWRSAALDFVNFTGTAGLWRASAIEAAGGWRSASLVEDCELSFRVLFAGYRTRFVKEIVVPAELPQTFAAYRLQQKRWTQGWAQLQRLHLATLLFRYPASWARKAVLTYVMCISWQWPLWMTWMLVFPFLIANGMSLAMLGTGVALLAYLAPPLAFAIFAAFAATMETRFTYSKESMDGLRRSRARRFARLFPYLVVNAGMLAHHVCAFVEGLFGPMHAEFERTPKTANVTAPSAGTARAAPAATARRPRGPARPAYAATETGLLSAQLGWVILFAVNEFLAAAAGAAWSVACILGIRLAPGLARIRRRYGRAMPP